MTGTKEKRTCSEPWSSGEGDGSAQMVSKHNQRAMPCNPGLLVERALASFSVLEVSNLI